MTMGSGRKLSVCRNGNAPLPVAISLSVLSDGDETLPLVCIIDLTAQIAQRRPLAQSRREFADLGCMMTRGYYCGHPEPPESFARLWLNLFSPREHVLS